MTKDELIKNLVDLEQKLLEPGVEARLLTDPDFVPLRSLVRSQRERIEIARLKDIESKLRSLSPQLTAGIDDLKRSLKTLDNIKETLGKLKKFLDVVAKVRSFTEIFRRFFRKKPPEMEF